MKAKGGRGVSSRGNPSRRRCAFLGFAVTPFNSVVVSVFALPPSTPPLAEGDYWGIPAAPVRERSCVEEIAEKVNNERQKRFGLGRCGSLPGLAALL